MFQNSENHVSLMITPDQRLGVTRCTTLYSGLMQYSASNSYTFHICLNPEMRQKENNDDGTMDLTALVIIMFVANQATKNMVMFVAPKFHSSPLRPSFNNFSVTQPGRTMV